MWSRAMEPPSSSWKCGLRTRDDYGGALESIDGNKRRRIVAAANGYLALLGREPPCRFDVVTIEERSAHWIRAAFDVAPG
jgi:putative endonuclease